MLAQRSYLIRPIRQKDAPDLLRLVEKSTGGLSSLQPRMEFLEDYIATSIASFSGQISEKTDVSKPHKYLLALIDVDQNKLIGCAAVKTQIGLKDPFINFDIIGDGDAQYLQASSRFMGATEVGSLFLDADYRAEGLGRYLAKSRYMLMATEGWRFGDTVIAELRGICGAEGSPLYDHLFADRLEKTFLEADTEYFDRNPDALGDIVPIGKISTRHLPRDVRASLAQPHHSGRSAMRFLQDEGFVFSGTIDLFDGGPIMSVYRDTLRTVMESQTYAVHPSPAAAQGGTSLLCCGETLQGFRAIITPTLVNNARCLVSPEVLECLDAEAGESVRMWQAPFTRSEENNRTAQTSLASTGIGSM